MIVRLVSDPDTLSNVSSAALFAHAPHTLRQLLTMLKSSAALADHGSKQATQSFARDGPQDRPGPYFTAALAAVHSDASPVSLLAATGERSTALAVRRTASATETLPRDRTDVARRRFARRELSGANFRRPFSAQQMVEMLTAPTPR